MADDLAGPGLPWRSLCGSVGKHHSSTDLMLCRWFPAGGDGHAYAIRAGPSAVGTPAGAPGARQTDGGSALRARASAGGAPPGGGGQVGPDAAAWRPINNSGAPVRLTSERRMVNAYCLLDGVPAFGAISYW